MANIEEIRALLNAGSGKDAFAKMVKFVEGGRSANELASVAFLMMPFSASSAHKAAELSLQSDPSNSLAMEALAEALARQGQFKEAEHWFLEAMPDLKTTERKRWSEPVSCPICGRDEGEMIDIRNLRRMHPTANLPDPIRVWVRCRNCDLVRVRDRLSSEAKILYSSSSGIPANNPPDLRNEFHNAFLREEVWCEHLQEVTGKAGRLLEVGAGWGTFMAAAAYRGFDVTGFEISQRNATWITDHLGLKVICGQAPADLPEELYDVVASFEVIEHCQEPELFLAGLADRVAPGGALALSTPFIDHPSAQVQGYTNWMWHEIDHKVYFDRATMAAALNRVGFSIERQWSSNRHLGCVAVIATRNDKISA